MRANLRLLSLDWNGAAAVQRYFMLSQLVSGVLLGVASLASVAANLAGHQALGLQLLAAASLCFVHTLFSWNVLRRRFKVRYEVF